MSSGINKKRKLIRSLGRPILQRSAEVRLRDSREGISGLGIKPHVNVKCKMPQAESPRLRYTGTRY